LTAASQIELVSSGESLAEANEGLAKLADPSFLTQVAFGDD